MVRGQGKKSKSQLAGWVANSVDEWASFFKPETTEGRELAEPFVQDALLAPADAELRT
jgi:hypothetical protein